MTVFHWVRHGPTHAAGMIGHTDLPADLTDAAALGRLAAALPEGAPVVSSDLARAVATADAIARDRPRLPHDPRLREIHFGDWEEMRHDEVTDRAAIRAFWDDPGARAAPGGESWDALVARVSAGADALRHLPEVIVVAHFGAILTQVQRGLGIGALEAFGYRIDTLSLTVVRDDPWTVPVVNRLP